MYKDYDYSISLLRVFAMFSILACHISSLIGISSLAQFLNIGVQIFLLISGYLYGKKNIKNYGTWIYNRYIRILIPIFIYILPIVIYCNIASIHNGYMDSLAYIFCLQGIDDIFGFLSFYNYPGTGHFWFITILMVCYLLTIPISHFYRKTNKKFSAVFFLFILFIISLILPFSGIYLALPLIYFSGYFYSKYFDDTNSTKSFVILTIIMVLSIGLRLFCKHYYDGTILYEHIVVSFSHNILAIWIFLTFRLIYKKFERQFEKIAKSNIIMHLDSISYYIYIVHYMFVDLFIITDIIPNKSLAVFLLLLLSFILAEILRFISEIIINKIKK